MDNREQLLQQFADRLVDDIRPLVKRFAPTVEASISPVGMQIKASPYISTLIDGRRPTRDGAPKGDPTLQEIIYEWILANGIKPREGSMTQEALSWAISQSIHKHGDRLYQQGGGRDIFAEVLTQNRIENFANLLGDSEQAFIAESAIKGLVL